MDKPDLGVRRSLGGRLGLLLLGAIVVPTVIISLWFAAELQREYEARVNAAIADTESELHLAFNTFDQLMAEEERILDRRMEERLPLIAKTLMDKGIPFDSIPVEELDRLAKENGFDHLYVIDRTTKVVNTNFAPDLDFTLGTISDGLRSFLTNLLDTGDLVIDRINVSSKTGTLKKYAYYGPKGAHYLFEASVDIKDYLTRVRSSEYTHFLFDELFGQVVAQRGLVTSVGIFIVNDIAFFPFLDYATPFDQSLASRLPSEKVVRAELGDELHVYKLIHLKGGRLSGAEYVAIRMVFDLKDIGHFTRNVKLIALLVGSISALVSLLISAILFRRMVVVRVDYINRSLERIGIGDYKRAVSVEGGDELAEIAKRIDDMRERLGQRDRELQNLNATLEERIATRTAELNLANVALRSARDEAEGATRLKDKFLSLVAHDLQSPLHGIRGMIDVLRGETLAQVSEVERDEIYEMIGGSVESLVTLIRTLLDMSRFQSGDITLQKRFVDARDLAEQAVSAIRPRAEEKRITLVNNVSENTPLLADTQMFVGVLGNLLSNAIKFSPSNGRVELFTPTGESTTIAVRDTGAGIAADMIGDLFRHDIKTVGVGSAGEVGTGLGLPYSAEIMKAHLGKLTVESQLGSGATFYAILPSVRVVALLVDDQEAHRAMMRDALAEYPHLGFVEASSGREALEGMVRLTPDLIVTDLSMDDVDGYAFIEALRENHAARDIPIVVAGSHVAEGEDAEKNVKNRLARYGVDGFIRKPIQREPFAALIGETLRKIGKQAAARGLPRDHDQVRNG